MSAKLNQLEESLADNVTRLQQASEDIKSSLEAKGVTVTGGFSTFSEAIDEIEVGFDVSDTTAREEDVLASKVFHKADGSSAVGTLVKGIDVSDTTASAGDVMSGKYFHKADGSFVEGQIAVRTVRDRTIRPESGRAFNAGYYPEFDLDVDLSQSNVEPENVYQGKKFYDSQNNLQTGTMPVHLLYPSEMEINAGDSFDFPAGYYYPFSVKALGGGVQMASDTVATAYKTSFNIDLPFEVDLFIGQYRNVSGALLGTVSLQRLDDDEIVNQWSFWTSARNSGATEVNHKYMAGSYNDAISDYEVTDDNHITSVTIVTATSSASYGTGTMEWFAFKF